MANNEVENKQLIAEFAKAGRTGRRNAISEINFTQASCGTSDLTAAMQKLQTSTGSLIQLLFCIYNFARCVNPRVRVGDIR